MSLIGCIEFASEKLNCEPKLKKLDKHFFASFVGSDKKLLRGLKHNRIKNIIKPNQFFKTFCSNLQGSCYSFNRVVLLCVYCIFFRRATEIVVAWRKSFTSQTRFNKGLW